jgi:hypothetical protein
MSDQERKYAPWGHEPSVGTLSMTSNEKTDFPVMFVYIRPSSGKEWWVLVGYIGDSKFSGVIDGAVDHGEELLVR